MKEKQITRVEYWGGLIVAIFTVAAFMYQTISGYGDLKQSLGSMQSSIAGLQTQENQNFSLISELVSKSSSHAEVNQPLSTNQN